MEAKMTGPQYSIQLASKISGVGVHTIRAWEKRYRAVCPARSASGRREYSDLDIERLTLLSELCILGHTIGKIAGLPTNELKVLLEKLGKKAETVESRKSDLTLVHSSIDTGESLNNLLMALNLYKLDVISHELNKLKLVLNPRELSLEIISPLLKEVGNSVIDGRFSISQEHALSSILKFHVGHMLFRGPNMKSTRPHRVLLSTPEGDYHEFGILLAALLCNYYNIPYFYLGPNLPVESLLDAYESLECNLIVLGSTIVPEEKPRNFLENYFNTVLGRIDKGRLLVGGNAHLQKEGALSAKNCDVMTSLESLDLFLKNL